MEIKSPYINLIVYSMAMRKRGRMIEIDSDGEPVGWCTYLVGTWNDVKRFHERPLFSVVEDMGDGPIIYIDYVVSLVWNKEIRDTIYSMLKSRHKSFKTGVWYRPTSTSDREVIWRAHA